MTLERVVQRPASVSVRPAAETVLTFLQSVGRRSEAELYLRLFRQQPKESFAIVAAEVSGAGHALGSLAEQLKYLSDLGLFAPVMTGLLDPLSAELSAGRLAEHLTAVGLSWSTHAAADPQLEEQLRGELASEVVPIVTFGAQVGDTAGRFALLGSLRKALGSRKIVFVREHGGLHPRQPHGVELSPGHRLLCHNGGISIINLSSDADALQKRSVLEEEDLELLVRVRELLDHRDAGHVLVNVTSPLTLLTELFTVRGAGTLIKRGTTIERHGSYGEVDCARLKALLESSFRRRLRPEFFGRAPLAVYVEPHYRGAAIVEPSDVGPLLSKFAVDPVAQGEGMGRDLWQAMVRDFDALVWRARPGNPINAFYIAQCDGMVRTDRWHVFWRRLGPEHVVRVVEELLGRAHDFVNV
jgi:GNAT superfamily N-acetyltransferase